MFAYAGKNKKPGPIFNRVSNFKNPADFDETVARERRSTSDLIFLVNGVRVVVRSSRVMRIICQLPVNEPLSVMAAITSGKTMFTLNCSLAINKKIPMIGGFLQ